MTAQQHNQRDGDELQPRNMILTQEGQLNAGSRMQAHGGVHMHVLTHATSHARPLA